VLGLLALGALSVKLNSLDTSREMPSIIYGGVTYMQVRHAVQCKKCLDTVESKEIHDFKQCSCGAVGVDGGLEDGNRILGDFADIDDRSVYCAKSRGKTVWLPPLRNPCQKPMT